MVTTVGALHQHLRDRGGAWANGFAPNRPGRAAAERPDRAGGGGERASRRRLCRLRIHHGLPEDAGAVLEEGAPRWRRDLGGSEGRGRRSGATLEAIGRLV